MNSLEISVRSAKRLDRDKIREVYARAFPASEKEAVATLADELLSEESIPETIALVAETDGMVVAHIAFSPVTVDTGENCIGYILAPLGVMPGYQQRGIGSILIDSGIQKLKDTGVDVLFVYGDPKYYGRFGFQAETAAKYLPPYALRYPLGWQAIALHGPGSAGHAVKISCVASLRNADLW